MSQPICPTTGESFDPVRTVEVSGLVWNYCPYCDTSRRTGEDYDQDAPQPHPVVPDGWADEEMEIGWD